MTKSQYQIILENELLYEEVSEDRREFIERELDGLKLSEEDN